MGKARLTFLIVLIAVIPITSQYSKHTASESFWQPQFSKFNINNISTFIYNNNISDFDLSTGTAAFEFPIGSRQILVFASGFVFGGIINDTIKVGGSVYHSGLSPGWLNYDGTSADPSSGTVRVYRVRPDYLQSNLQQEMADENKSEADIRSKYEEDWNEWPASKGAPFFDKNNDGIYEPEIDVPGIPGASQTLWFTDNDSDTLLVSSLYGSVPIGIELQTTVWGYRLSGILDNVIFKKYRIINKRAHEIKKMFFSIWSDIELGLAENDFAGCDTTLNLVYIYNNEQTDPVLEGPPPAVGIRLLLGPVVPGGIMDTAIFQGRKIPRMKNLEMVSVHYLYPFQSPVIPYFEPVEGDYINGSLKYYNFMQGKISNGTYYPVPEQFGGGTTRYPLSGDPVNGTGFLDGIQVPPSDRSVALGIGPINLAQGDTQEVVFAQIVGTGTNNLNSVTVLKNNSTIADSFYNANFMPQPSQIDQPEVYQLLQNYPNPFNSTTRIRFNLFKPGNVKLIILDILGRTIVNLLDSYLPAGEFFSDFDGKNLPSGVYFYRLIVNNSAETKKLVLIKIVPILHLILPHQIQTNNPYSRIYVDLSVKKLPACAGVNHYWS